MILMLNNHKKFIKEYEKISRILSIIISIFVVSSNILLNMSLVLFRHESVPFSASIVAINFFLIWFVSIVGSFLVLNVIMAFILFVLKLCKKINISII